ncbi:hypothetical protein J4401_04795 [Candidatus Woesearchaeota archaeon]|nr:hypothetical protein [Candidatus Woesearchaeota archaeon]
MANYIFSNIAGNFVIDSGNRIIDKSSDAVALRAKYKAVEHADAKIVLSLFRGKEYLSAFREKNLAISKEKIRLSVNQDNLISQSMNAMQEMEKVSNLLSKRLREWYSLYNPEFSESISSNSKFSELVSAKSREELLKEIGAKNTMGADLGKTDLDAINVLASAIVRINATKESTREYAENIMKSYCPNLLGVAGVSLSARLIEHTGSLKKLAFIPSSTIQLLGAEKALFRHMRTGSRPPRHGFISEHQSICSAPQKERGKLARQLAARISKAVKIDYFRGKHD